jgi:hypothetical protein
LLPQFAGFADEQSLSRSAGQPVEAKLMDNDDLKHTHAPIFSLQTEMKEDRRFKALCEEHGLPWDFAAGYEPRGYNGPAPERTKLLVLLAEPGAITRTEAQNLSPAIRHSRWIEPYDLSLQEHYWRANLLELCRYVGRTRLKTACLRTWVGVPHFGCPSTG